MIRRKASSVLSTLKVKRGGINKKSHIKALNRAASSTGKISKKRVKIDTVTNNRNATTLYPINPEKKKLIIETAEITATVIIYWCTLIILFEKIFRLPEFECSCKGRP